MNWVRELPKVSGLYWLYEHRLSPPQIVMVEVDTEAIWAREQGTVSTVGWDIPENLSRFAGYWWMGPIPVPPPPE